MKLLLIAVILCVQMYATQGDEDAVSKAINKFSKALYSEVSGRSTNVVVSPFSVEAVVAMLLLGLQGDTEKQIARALFLPESRSTTAQGFKSMFASLQASQDVTLEIANKIYIQTGFNVKDEFLKETSDKFNSVTEEVNIAEETEQVRKAVNDWAASKTHDKVKDLLAPGVLTGDVVMILLNAIYFKGLWKTQFDKTLTTDRPFHLSSGSTKTVPMMNLEKHLPYTSLFDLDVQVLKLPYKGDKFSMLIFLPRDVNGLKKLESNLDKLDVYEIQNTFYDIEVVVALPRFKILNTIKLNGPLSSLGMSELFSTIGNFSGITDEPIYVSKALQKAYIEVNEEGTEAAAVTALLVAGTTSVHAPPPREYFIADHPFIYMIVAEDKKTVLFMGRVMDPTEKSLNIELP